MSYYVVTPYTYVCWYDIMIIHSDIDECTRGTSGCDHNCTNMYLCFLYKTSA